RRAGPPAPEPGTAVPLSLVSSVAAGALLSAAATDTPLPIGGGTAPAVLSVVGGGAVLERTP
ncbi:MAG: hypothetical protein ABI560_02310, partial [Myxococcales bacterium]